MFILTSLLHRVNLHYMARLIARHKDPWKVHLRAPSTNHRPAQWTDHHRVQWISPRRGLLRDHRPAPSRVLLPAPLTIHPPAQLKARHQAQSIGHHRGPWRGLHLARCTGRFDFRNFSTLER